MQWDSGTSHSYRVGAEDAYNLVQVVVDPLQRFEVVDDVYPTASFAIRWNLTVVPADKRLKKTGQEATVLFQGCVRSMSLEHRLKRVIRQVDTLQRYVNFVSCDANLPEEWDLLKNPQETRQVQNNNFPQAYVDHNNCFAKEACGTEPPV